MAKKLTPKPKRAKKRVVERPSTPTLVRDLRAKAGPYSATLTRMPSGGHKWTVNFHGNMIAATTSSSSVSTIDAINSKFAPALKRLADK